VCITHARECIRLIILYGPCKYDLAVVLLVVVSLLLTYIHLFAHTKRSWPTTPLLWQKRTLEVRRSQVVTTKIDVCPPNTFCVLARQVEAMSPANLPFVGTQPLVDRGYPSLELERVLSIRLNGKKNKKRLRSNWGKKAITSRVLAVHRNCIKPQVRKIKFDTRYNSRLKPIVPNPSQR